MRIIIIYFMLSITLVNAHPYEPDGLMNYPPFINLSFNKTNYYKSQLEFDFFPFNWEGYYKDIFSHLFNIGYAPRLNLNNKIEHRFKFLFVEYNGIFYNNILKYGNGYSDTLSGEYLFNHSGIKFIEWDNFEMFNEFKVIQLSTELILENRTYHKNHLIGLPFQPNEHNPYFISRVSTGISKFRFEEGITDSSIQSNGSYWDVPLCLYSEFGYDWIHKKTIRHQTKLGIQLGWRDVINSISIFLDYKYLPVKNLSDFTYGIKLKLDPDFWGIYLNLALQKREIIYMNTKYFFYDFSIGIPISL